MKGLASHFARIDTEDEAEMARQDRENELKEEILNDIRQAVEYNEYETERFDIDMTEVFAEIERLIDNKMEELKNG